jgi:hypothetical protein
MKPEPRPTPSARALRWWSAAALAPLQSRVGQACSDWSARWGVPARCVGAFNACEPRETSALGWQPLAAPGLWLGSGGAGLAELLHAELFGASLREQTLAAEVASRAANDLTQSLCSTWGDTASAVAATDAAGDGKPWSGSVRFKLALGAQPANVWVHVASELVAAHAAPSTTRSSPAGAPAAKLTSVLRAVGREPLAFKVELTGAEVSLGDLQSLRVGDVLTLAHRLDMPLLVHPAGAEANAGTTPVCLAYLGAQRGHRAIELLRTDTDLT